MVNQKTLIVIPSFNERENIAALVEKIVELYPSIDILVVDDSSPDGTPAVVEELHRRFPERLKAIIRQGKGGRGSAVLDGFRYALQHGYDLVFEMDADFSHKPEEIGRFLEKIHGFDMVTGSRYLPGSEIHEWGRKRTFFSKWANRYARLILRIPMSDYTNGFRCYTRHALEMLDMDGIDARGYVVLSEVAYQLHKKGARIGEVPTVFVNRRRGISNLSTKEIQEAFLSVLRIRSPRLYQHAHQALKFGLAGLIGGILDFSLLNFFTWFFSIDPRFANVFSTLIASVVVFLLNKKMAFRHRKGNTGNQAFKFLIVYGVAYVLNIAFTALFITAAIHLLHTQPTHLVANVSKALAIGVVMFWNYFLLHSFVFREH